MSVGTAGPPPGWVGGGGAVGTPVGVLVGVEVGVFVGVFEGTTPTVKHWENSEVLLLVSVAWP